MARTNEEIIRQNRQFNLFSWSVQSKVNPLPIESAEGVYFFDAEGNRYLDLASQLINCNIGHQHPKAIAALKEQAEILTFAAPKYSNSKKGECAEKVIGVLPDNFGKVLFTNAGAEANENAIKMARAYTGKHKILARYRSYHGASYGGISATGDPRRWDAEPGIPGIIRCLDPYCYRCPFGKERSTCNLDCANHVEEVLMYEGGKKHVAAMIIEPVVGANGIIVPPDGYMERIRQILDDNDVLLICDEIMASWGRTGKWFAFQNWDIKPDIVTTAKGITSGYVPLGAVCVSSKIADFYDNNFLSCGLTYSGHTLAVGTACRVIDIYREENLIEHSKTIGKYVGDCLEELMDRHPCIGEVRGLGLFRGIELVYNRLTKEPMCPFGGGPSPLDELNKFAMENGVALGIHWNVVQYAPPLVITKAQVDESIDVLDRGFDLMDRYVK